MLVEQPYVIFHEQAGEAVLILRILHGRRRITKRLVDESGD